MQPRRRRGHGSARSGEHRLIAVTIVASIGALDVRRQRDMTDGVNRGLEGRSVLGPQANHPPALKSALEYLTVYRVHTLEHHALPGSQAAVRDASRPPNARRPQPRTPASGRVSAARPTSRHSTAPPPGTRRPRRRAGKTRVLFTTSTSPAAQRRGEISDHSVADLAARPIETEQAGRATLGGRLLRNQLGRQIEVEVAYQHLGYRRQLTNHRAHRARTSHNEDSPRRGLSIASVTREWFLFISSRTERQGDDRHCLISVIPVASVVNSIPQ